MSLLQGIIDTGGLGCVKLLSESLNPHVRYVVLLGGSGGGVQRVLVCATANCPLAGGLRGQALPRGGAPAGLLTSPES